MQRGIFYQKKQRIYESKKEREDYRKETTRKHMAEREELRVRAEDRIREQERKRQEANRERVREARAEKAPGHHSHGALSDEKVKNGRKQDQVLASIAAVGQIPEQRVFTERKVLDQDSSGSNSYETESITGSREGGNRKVKSKIVAAMDAAGYHFDELESSDDQLRFLGEYGTVMYMDSWKEAKEWLEGVVFDDPAVLDRVEKILHPEHFKERKTSVLRKLEKKKDELNTAKQRTSVTKQRKRRVPNL